MVGFLLWCILFVMCWPLALAALVLYPIVWLLLLPFRLVGIAVHGVLELVWAIITLPARVLRHVCVADRRPSLPFLAADEPSLTINEWLVSPALTTSLSILSSQNRSY